jgi:hypothetical protein
MVLAIVPLSALGMPLSMDRVSVCGFNRSDVSREIKARLPQLSASSAAQHCRPQNTAWYYTCEQLKTTSPADPAEDIEHPTASTSFV